MEDGLREQTDPSDLTLRIIGVNFAAIHTTSMVSRFFLTSISLTFDFVKTFSRALYQLLAQ